MLPRRVCSGVCILGLLLLPSSALARPGPLSTPPAPAVRQPPPACLFAAARPTPTATPNPTPLPTADIEFSPDGDSPNLVAAEHGGRVVWVSDQLERYPASNLIDGNRHDYGEWWTHEPPEFPQVVVFALAHDQERIVDRVVLNPWTSEWRYGWVKDFEIYVSTTSFQLEDMDWVGSFTLEHAGIDQTFTLEPVRARYVALVITSHYGSDEGITLNEFEVYAAPAGTTPMEPGHIPNLAAASAGGYIAEVSSEDSTGKWPAVRLIDGLKDTETGWSSAPDLETRQYVVFGLAGDQPHQVGEVTLNPYSKKYDADWIKDFELYGSETSANLHDMQFLGSSQLEQQGEDQTFTFDPVPLRYIALVPTSNYGGDAYALNEFEVHPTPGQGAEEFAQKQAALPEEQRPQITPQPTQAPQLTFIATDFKPRTAGAAALVENIEFQIEHSDVLPLLYHLYGNYFPDLVKVGLTNHNDAAVSVRVEAQIPHYTELAVETVSLGPGETVDIAQNPPLLPDALDLLRDMKMATLHVQIDLLAQGERKLVYEDTLPTTIYSREDFPWAIPGYHTGRAFISAMVTPNDPALDELMRVAADYAPGGIIVSGYGDATDSDGKVYNNMKAVYEAVAEYYNMTYVCVGLPFLTPEQAERGFHLQRIKLPYEVLQSHSGMCIELSLLFASAFEKMSLDPIIIIVPGHAFVAVPIGEGSSTYYFLETTVVGCVSFDDALRLAGQEFEEALPELSKDRWDNYYWVDVRAQQREGVWPIPWR